MSTKLEHGVTVEMAPSGHVMMRFAEAVASSPGEPTMLEGRVSVSVTNIEVAKTLRDALSGLIAFHEGVSTGASR